MAKMGRPKSDNPKVKNVTIRLTEEAREEIRKEKEQNEDVPEVASLGKAEYGGNNCRDVDGDHHVQAPICEPSSENDPAHSAALEIVRQRSETSVLLPLCADQKGHSVEHRLLDYHKKYDGKKEY